MSKYKHFFFDMDGTLTESRSPISHDMKKLIHKIDGDIIVISGAEKKQMRKQVGNLAYLLSQSGAECRYWKLKLKTKEKEEVLAHVDKIRKFFPHYFKNGEGDLLQDRGCQMSFSFIGHNADLEKKKQFDRSGVFRKTVLNTIPFTSETLEVRVGGTTCFDYTNKEFVKGKSLQKLIKYEDWNKDECVYFGDALFEGGNDETVIGVMDTVQVENPQDLLNKLKQYV